MSDKNNILIVGTEGQRGILVDPDEIELSQPIWVSAVEDSDGEYDSLDVAVVLSQLSQALSNEGLAPTD